MCGKLFSAVRIFFLFLILSFLTASTDCTAEPRRPKPLRVFPNEYIVEAAARPAAASGLAAFNKTGLDILRETTGGLMLVAPHTTALNARRLSAASREAVDYDPSDSFCPQLLKHGLAKSCSPNFEISIDAAADDPMLKQLWGLSVERGIDAPAAWDVTTGSQDLVVAVIDTGIDYTHPDLVDNMWRNDREIPGNGLDDDNNGFIDDVYGMSTWNNGDPFDDNRHGTHVAGTIGARGDNGLGVSGVNWRVRLMACKFLNSSGSGDTFSAIQAVNYVVMMKKRGVNVRLMNNSWGGSGYSQPLFDAIKAARDAGIVFVASAGNDGLDNDLYPAYPSGYELSNVVSVAAIGLDQTLAVWTPSRASNYGAASVDIAAPGTAILSTAPGGGYVMLSGTSMAAPHVTGALALLMAAEPALNTSQTIARLYESGQAAAALSGMIGSGRTLNAARMLHRRTSPLPAPTPTPPPCPYQVEEIPYSPDYSADLQPIVQQADELQFYELPLPFTFPFHRKELTSVRISPNGLIRTDRFPIKWDYLNGSQAPFNSIAALHTDLTAETYPFGVRVATRADAATIYWRAHAVDAENLGEVEVRATLYPDGRIESFISIPNPSLEQLVQSMATLGLTGSNLESASTYAYNSKKIRNMLGLRYTRLCQDTPTPPRVLDITVAGQAPNGEEVQRALSGQALNIRLTGSGSGTLQLFGAFNGQACPGSADVSLVNGRVSLQTVMPRVSYRYQSVSLQAGSKATTTLRIKNSISVSRRPRSRSSKLAPAAFAQNCSFLLKNLVEN